MRRKRRKKILILIRLFIKLRYLKLCEGGMRVGLVLIGE